MFSKAQLRSLRFKILGATLNATFMTGFSMLILI
jgi:Co/Zn/Cd efflux system component